MTQIKERPILFSGPMVRAILEGQKTQTRRVFKGTTEFGGPYNPAYIEAYKNATGWKYICPHGRPGDRLWVRESIDATYGCDATYVADGRRLVDAHPKGWDVWGVWEDNHILPPRKIPHINMPRWASRITLEIKTVRVERLQDISEEDAVAEGIFKCGMESGKSLYAYDGLTAGELRDDFTSPINVFRHLWESINGPGSWDANPWVWAIEFERVKP